MLIASPNVTAAVAAAQASAAAAASSATAAAASATLAATFASDSDPTETYPTKASVEVSTIASATQFVRTAGYTTPGDHGGALYVRVTSEPLLPGKIRSTDRYLPDGTTSAANGGWWKIKMPRVTPQMFGAKADNSTNDYQAIMDAINHELIGTGGARPVDFPPGKYKVGSTIDLKKVVHLNGLGGVGQDGYHFFENAAELIFPADTTGICVNRTDTLSTGMDSPATTGADGSIIEGLVLTGSGTNRDRHGIWLRARAILRNLVIDSFPGNGVNIVATAGGSALLHGNANGWQADTLSINFCGRQGFYTAGSDANAGEGRNISVNWCGRWGIYDFSFLGNTYYTCHTTYNGIGERPTYGEVYYHAMPTATELQLVQTTPGTNSAVWQPAGAHPGAPDDWLPGQPEGTYFAGGAYRINGDVNGTRLICCYAEAGQGPSAIGPAGQCLMGAMYDNGFTIGGNMAAANGNQFMAKSLSALEGGYGMELVPSAAGSLWRGYKGNTDDALNCSRTGTDWQFNIGANSALKITGGTTAETFKTGSAKIGWGWFPTGFAVGTGTITHRQYTANSMPTGDAAQGDVAWNVRFNGTGASTGLAAWVCIDSGNPGTWRVMALADYQEINTDAAFTLYGNISETRHTGTLTADRAVALDAFTFVKAANAGCRIRITRTGAGAFNLNVGTGPLKALATNTWCEVVYDGSAWYLAAYGAL